MTGDESRFTSDRRSPESSSWVDAGDWEAGSLSNVDVVDGTIVAQKAGGPIETADSAIYTGKISDSTTHTNLTASGATLYSTTVEHGEAINDYDEYAIRIDVTAVGSNTSGTGRYPALGFKLTNASGDLLFRYSDGGEWINTSGDRYDIPDGELGRVIVIDGSVTYSFAGETTYAPANATFEPPITAHFTSSETAASGGGGNNDAIYSCEATIEVVARSL
jgi:hypothetical protein